jgi:hypothetical protein
VGHVVKLGGYLSASAAAGGVRHSTVDPSREISILICQNQWRTKTAAHRQNRQKSADFEKGNKALRESTNYGRGPLAKARSDLIATLKISF